MISKNIKSFDDILKHISALEARLANLESELRSINDILHLLTNKDARIRKEEIKEELEGIDYTLEEYDTFLQSATTFNKDDLDKFFIRYFSIIYGIKYSVQTDIKDKSEGIHYVLTDLIASNQDFAKIDQYFNLRHKVDLDEVIDLCEDTCICLGGQDPYPLLRGVNLNDELKEFPELNEAVKLLVDLKLSDPNLSNQQRLALCLKIMTTRFAPKQEPMKTTEEAKPIIIKETQTYKPVEPIIPPRPQVRNTEEPTPIPETSKKEELVLRKSLIGKYIK